MNFIFTGECGEMVAINADHIVHANFNEKLENLSLTFVGGSSLELTGTEAIEVWKNIFETEDEEDETFDIERLESIEETVSDLEKQVARNRVDSLWEVERLEEFIDFLPENIPDELITRAAKLKDRFKTVAAKAESCYYAKLIAECNASSITRASSINSTLRKLDEIEDALSEGNTLTDELSKKIRAAKERVAWYRAKKKLDESTVAEAGGNSNKANKLVSEAVETLKQDWSLVFPSETPPPITASR